MLVATVITGGGKDRTKRQYSIAGSLIHTYCNMPESLILITRPLHVAVTRHSHCCVSALRLLPVAEAVLDPNFYSSNPT